MRIWLAIMAVLVAAAVIVPYFGLAGGSASFAVPIFWVGFGAAVALMIALATRRWRD